MHRRDFIQISAYTSAALALPFASGCSQKPIDIEAQPLFFSHIVDAKTIVQIGYAYRRANPVENDKDMLQGLLSVGSTLSTPANDKAIGDMLDRQVSNDFKTGKIAVIDGWVLSVTEARQCALFSLLQA
jgi:hypothetical protein